MKIKLWFLLIPFLFILSCDKKETCSYNIYYLGEELALEGYDTTVFNNIKHIILDKSNDTIVSAYEVQVLSYQNKEEKLLLKTLLDNQGPIQEKYNHQIIIAGDTFKISNITVGPRSETFTMKDHCSPGAGQARFYPFEEITLNGIKTKPFSISGPISYIVFKKP